MSSLTTRFTDLEEETVSQFPTPLHGYKDAPVETLEKTIEPVKHFLTNPDMHIWVAKENSKEPKEGLTQEESASIRLYTMDFSNGQSLYKALNQTLRLENRENVKPWFKYLKLFLTALNKLPSHSQTVWRGVRNVDLSTQYPKGKKGAWWGISSCTNNVEVLQSSQFLGTTGDRILFSIECHHGKSISFHSQYQSEEEIIIMPGFYFEVIGQLPAAEGLRIIHLKEIYPPVPPCISNESSVTTIAPKNLIGCRNKVGQIVSFMLTGTNGGSVWGTDIYTDDSDVSTAAVHAGIINTGQSKLVHIRILSGQMQYMGSIRNGISTSSYPAWVGSYSFIGNENTSQASSSNSPVIPSISSAETDLSGLTDFPIFSGQTSMSRLYMHNYPNAAGPMCGSSDDNEYIILFYTIPFASLICLKSNRCISVTVMNVIVSDICWSKSTQTFIISTPHHIYEFDPSNKVLSQPYGTLESIKNYWTVACDSNDLFIVYFPDMSMCKRHVKKPFEVKQEWMKKEIMCNEGDQIIGSIRINEENQILALTIKQSDDRWRVDLFQINNMQRLHCGNTFGFRGLPNRFYCMVLPLLNNYNQWLVVNATTGQQSQIILLDEKGQDLNEINSDVLNITLVGTDKIGYLTPSGITVCRRKI